MNIDKITAKKLSRPERDALVTALRHPEGRIAARIEADGGGSGANGHLQALTLMGLLSAGEVVAGEDGQRDHVYQITGRGKRVARALPEVSGAALETMYVKIVPDDAPNVQGQWITIENFDIVALENAMSVTEQFYMLRRHIPKGFHPVQMERQKPGD